ncbi:hypothetical protein BT96DRAFT_1051341 [Gymnopus androsaceus JB14]|uniref:Rhodopsin domain-containing protein n=1 Tax=Gymnopus androsaceus JB14 TaxID=1447944 RepID=A0A6A4I9R8_9AGAR|nr:hypothetical protein BT96DRAFT_1051341 [Gymnopus androsaceus JB14]
MNSTTKNLARVWIRYRKQRLWWDDGWAILTMMVSILVDVSLIGEGSNPLIPVSPRVLAAQFWLNMISFTLAIWFARISLMLSIVRLIPPLFTLRRVSEWAAIFFSLLTILVHYVIPSMPVGKKIAISELITDLLADIAVVVLPICLLRNVNLPKDKRRMLMVIFGASLLTSATSVVHAVFLIGSESNSNDFYLIPITAQVEVGTALAVANLGVLTPFLYRLIGKSDGDIDSKPCTHYPSFQTNGDIRMRRVSDLVASGIRLTDTGRISTSVHVQDPGLRKEKMSN